MRLWWVWTSGRIIKGAKIAKEQCKSTILRDNKAGIIGTLLYVADLEQKRNVHVIMPYCDRLQKFCQWLQQLWSESLGKAQNLSGDLVNNGPTLLTARGAADQHSQLQLFTEGPENKVIFFLTLKDHAGDINIPVENWNSIRSHPYHSGDWENFLTWSTKLQWSL